MSHVALSWFAIQHGWSVVKWMPARADDHDFRKMLNFASSLGPVLIIIEDVEKMITDDEMSFSRLLDDLDGATTKTSNVVTLMTTNHPDQLPKAVWRRFHGVVEYKGLDKVGIERLIKVSLGEMWEGYESDDELRSTLYDIDQVVVDRQNPSRVMDEVVEMLYEYGFNQWLIRQVVDRATTFALNQVGERMFITQSDMINAAISLIPQYNLYREADHGPTGSATLDEKFASILEEVVGKYSIVFENGTSGELVLETDK